MGHLLTKRQALPERLFKFIDGRYAEAFIQEGVMLFRNLSYFRTIEHAERGDFKEGLHRDHPDHPVEITNLTTGRIIRGDFAALNSIRSDKVFAYCLTTTFDPRLFHEFGDTCIEIHNVSVFVKRAQSAIARLVDIDTPKLLARHVIYYDENRSTDEDIKNGRVIPFLKGRRYENQREFRLIFGRRGAFEVTMRITNSLHTFDEELKALRTASKLLKLGPLGDICIVHRSGQPSLEASPHGLVGAHAK
jgi:hypothetical protein